MNAREKWSIVKKSYFGISVVIGALFIISFAMGSRFLDTLTTESSIGEFVTFLLYLPFPVISGSFFCLTTGLFYTQSPTVN